MIIKDKNFLSRFTIILVLLLISIMYFLNRQDTNKIDGLFKYCSSQASPPDFCNEIEIKSLSPGRIYIQGRAYWAGNGTGNVNEGNISGPVDIDNNKAYYENNQCKIDFSFEENQIIVKEKEDSVCGGLNVSFDGIYSKMQTPL